jgi:uncharacterized protein
MRYSAPVLFWLMLGVAVWLLVGVVGQVGRAAGLAEAPAAALALAVGQLALLLGVIWGLRRGLAPMLCWRWSYRHLLCGGLIGVGAYLLAALLMQLIEQLSGGALPLQSSVELLQRSTGGERIGWIILAGVGAPIIEEIYFRGVWQQLVAQRWGSRLAIVSVALLFALLHSDVPLLLPILWLVACLWGWAAERWGLGAAVVAHLLFNWMTITAILLGFV